MFSPYYAWSKDKDPMNHCAVNVVLYGPDGRWTMTERGRGSLRRSANHLAIGPSALHWTGDGLTIEVDEISPLIPRRVRGTIRVEPQAINPHPSVLDWKGRHIWHPFAPAARVSVDLAMPDMRWTGPGYFDMNRGDEPLADAFTSWSWSRAHVGDDTFVFYDARGLDDAARGLAFRFDGNGERVDVEAPPLADLPRGLWGMTRQTRCEAGRANVHRGLEDAPFYTRSLVETTLAGRRVVSMHESLSLPRFVNPLVRLMLPFRMPRAPGWFG